MQCELLPTLGGGGMSGVGGSGAGGAPAGRSLSFASAKNYPSGGRPSLVALADMDGDGHPDIVVVTASSDNSTHQVNLLLNQGDGTFAAPRSYPVSGGLAPFLAVGDVNGDGKPDVAVTDAPLVVAASFSVDVMLNYGDGTLTGPSHYSIPGIPGGLVLADLDGDGHNDVVALSATFPEAGKVSVLSNRGDGTFTAARTFSAGKEPSAVVAGDLNGDGRVDLAVADAFRSPGSGDDLFVLLNQGGGTFAAPVVYPGGDSLSDVAAADLDGDGDRDLVVIDWRSNLNVLTNNGDGTFVGPVSYAKDPWVAFALGDVTGDGRVDIVAAVPLHYVASGWIFGNVSVLVNGANTVFSPQVDFGDEPIEGSIALGDLNGDGKLDVVAVNHSYDCVDSISVLLNTSP